MIFKENFRFYTKSICLQMTAEIQPNACIFFRSAQKVTSTSMVPIIIQYEGTKMTLWDLVG